MSLRRWQCWVPHALPWQSSWALAIPASWQFLEKGWNSSTSPGFQETHRCCKGTGTEALGIAGRAVWHSSSSHWSKWC